MINKINNIKINEKDKCVLVSINPEIYSLDVVYSAAYILMDRAYVILDGDPKEEIMVELKAKDGNENLEVLARDFGNELLNYAVYKSQSEKNKRLREIILQRVLLTNIKIEGEQGFSDSGKLDYIKDEAGIIKPWKSKQK